MCCADDEFVCRVCGGMFACLIVADAYAQNTNDGDAAAEEDGNVSPKFGAVPV